MASLEENLNDIKTINSGAVIMAEEPHIDDANEQLVSNIDSSDVEPIMNDYGDPENFRDILCIIIASIFCCPLLPCASWMSMYYHQKATEAYYIGDYTTAALKQSVSVKILVGHCVISPIIVILFIVLLNGELTDIYPVQLENGAE